MILPKLSLNLLVAVACLFLKLVTRRAPGKGPSEIWLRFEDDEQRWLS